MKHLLLALFCISCQAMDPPDTSAIRSAFALGDQAGQDVLASGNNNDWRGSFCTAAGICRLVGNAAGSTITGLDESYFGSRDATLWLKNDSANPIRIANASTASSLNNRIHTRTGEDIILGQGYGILLRADADWSTDPFTPLGWDELTDNSIASVLHTTPTRTLGTAFRPSASRPVHACYSVRIETSVTVTGGQEGRIDLLTDAANPPTTVRASIPGRMTGTVVVGVALTSATGGALCAMVKPGDFVLLQSTTVTGTPTYSITQQVEDLL